MTAPTLDPSNLTPEEVRHALVHLNARAWGISVGLLFGLGLFVATNVLVVRGGEPVGPPLALLRLFFPGSSVRFAGSLIGFVYAFGVGYAAGRLSGGVYNRLAGR